MNSQYSCQTVLVAINLQALRRPRTVLEEILPGERLQALIVSGAGD